MTPNANHAYVHGHLLQCVPQVIADMRAVIQDHATNKVEASGVANALYVTLLHDIALPSQQDVSFATQLRKAISIADLTPTGAVQVALAVQLTPCSPLLTYPSSGSSCSAHTNVHSSSF